MSCEWCIVFYMLFFLLLFVVKFMLVSLVARSVLYIVVVVLEMLWIHQVLSLYVPLLAEISDSKDDQSEKLG